MFLFNNAIRAHSKTIRGIQYVVFSNYGSKETIYDRIGHMIENSFKQTDTVEITKSSLVNNDIAFGDE